MDVIRKPGRPKGSPKTGGRKRGTRNKLRKLDILDRIVRLEIEVEELKRRRKPEASARGVDLWAVGAGQCRWPSTDIIPISDFRFCGRECVAGLSWCHEHARLAIAEAK